MPNKLGSYSAKPRPYCPVITGIVISLIGIFLWIFNFVTLFQTSDYRSKSFVQKLMSAFHSELMMAVSFSLVLGFLVISLSFAL